MNRQSKNTENQTQLFGDIRVCILCWPHDVSTRLHRCRSHNLLEQIIVIDAYCHHRNCLQPTQPRVVVGEGQPPVPVPIVKRRLLMSFVTLVTGVRMSTNVYYVVSALASSNVK
jgi:hypothetical protein